MKWWRLKSVFFQTLDFQDIIWIDFRLQRLYLQSPIHSLQRPHSSTSLMTSIKASNPSHPSHPHDLNLSSTYSHHLNTSLENLDQLYDQLEELLIHSTHLSHHLKTLKPSSSLLHPSSRLSRLSWISISNFSSHSLKLKSSTSTSSTPNLLHHPSSHSSQSQNESSSYFDIEGQSLFLPILIHKSVQEIYQRG